MPQSQAQNILDREKTSLQTTLEGLVRHGRRPRTWAERRAGRAVDYGDYLQALMDEVRVATDGAA